METEKNIFEGLDLEICKPLNTFCCSCYFEKEQIKEDVRKEMRMEFFNVYSKNELFYQKYVSELKTKIKIKELEINVLLDTLQKTTAIAQVLYEKTK